MFDSDYDPFARLEYKDFAPKVRRALDPDWRQKAACRGLGATPEGMAQWFPGPGGSQSGKLICRDCKVKAECLNYADERGIEWGIWGGEIRRRKTKAEDHTY